MRGKVVIVGLVTLAMAVIAGLGLVTQEAWLAPSLASALYAQAFSPDQPTAKPYSILVGQLIGAASGFAGVFITGAAMLPQFMTGHELVSGRVLAVVVAMLLASAGQVAAKATSPAGGATALLVALGAETATLAGAGRLLAGILLITVIGEGVRQLALRAR